MFSKDERENINLYRQHLIDFTGNKEILPYGTFYHFYSFANSICDKFAAWQGRIGINDVILKNEDFLLKELVNPAKGQIILVSHFGNIEITNAISENFDGFILNALTYDKNSKNFNQVLNSIQKTKIKFICVEELNIQSMMELNNLLLAGEHIGIMGDRIPIHNSKKSKVTFLGKDAYFPQGAFLLSGLLDVKISTLWCQKIDGKYEIELCHLCDGIKLLRDKSASIKPYLNAYVKELEKRCIKTPYQWYNFYDFWSEK